MIKPMRIAAYSYDVAIARVIACQFFKVPNLEFWRPRIDGTHFFRALEPSQESSFHGFFFCRFRGPLALSRKKLLRLMAVGSSREAINLDLLYHHHLLRLM
jgi:hypothetical protein